MGDRAPLPPGARAAALSNTAAFINGTSNPSGIQAEKADPNAATNYVGAMQQFFGPSPKKIDLDLESMRPHEAYFLPDAYKGRSDFLRNTVVDLMSERKRNNFLTSVILPLRRA